MHRWCVVPGLVAVLALPSASGGQSRPANLKVEEHVQELIKALDSGEFSKRHAAQRALEKIGEPALAALEKAAASGSAEVAARARLAIRAIQKTLFIQVRAFEGHRPRPDSGDGSWVTRVALTPDGRQALTAGPDGLRLWDIRTGKVILFFGQPERRETASWAVAISADGQRAITGSNGSMVRVWDLKTGKLLQTIAGHTNEVWGVAFLRDGRRAVSASWDTTIRIWDIQTGRELRRFSAGDKMRSMALSGDGKRLAVGHFVTESQPSTLRLWDLDKGQEMRSFIGHTQAIVSVAFSPDQKSLLTASWDKTVRLWNLTSGKEERCFRHQGRACWADFTPDGCHVVSSGNDMDPVIRVWDLQSAKQIRGSETCPSGMLCLTVLPDGRHCISAGRDCSVRLWEWK